MAPDSIYGSLNILVLRVLTEGPAHGLAVKHALEAATGGELQVEPGSLYPALHRLQRDGLVAGDWGVSPEGRRAKVYHLTKAGQISLAKQVERWDRHVETMSAVLDGCGEAST